MHTYDILEIAPEVSENLESQMRAKYPDFLFFTTLKRGVRRYQCTACEADFLEGDKITHRTMLQEDYLLRHAPHKSLAVCPSCKRTLTVRNSKIGTIGNTFRAFALFIPVSENEVWFRCYGTYVKYDYGKKAIEKTEWCRYRLTPGDALFWKKEGRYGDFMLKDRYEDPFIWNHYCYTEKYDYDILCDSTGPFFNDTFLRYCAYEELNNYMYNVPVIRYLCHYAHHPQLEMLVKFGHRSTLMSVLFRGENKRVLDWSAKTPWDLYRLTRAEYKIWEKSKDFEVLKVYKKLGTKGEQGFKDAKTLLKWNYTLKKALTMAKDIQQMNTKVSDVCNYLIKTAAKRKISEYTIFSEWLDYIDMAKKEKKIENINPMPKNLKKEHDRLVKRKTMLAAKDGALKMRRSAELEAKHIREKFKKIEPIYEKIRTKYEYTGKEMLIKAPESIADIILEGYVLDQCLCRTERYFERIQRKESYILFVRRTEEPDVPYYTIEIEPSGVVRQKRTFGDDEGEDIAKVITFLKEWQKAIAPRLTAADKKLAQKSKEEREKGFAELRKNKTIVRTGYLTGQLLADVLEADLLELSFEQEDQNETKEAKVG